MKTKLLIIVCALAVVISLGLGSVFDHFVEPDKLYPHDDPVYFAEPDKLYPHDDPVYFAEPDKLYPHVQLV